MENDRRLKPPLNIEDDPRFSKHLAELNNLPMDPAIKIVLWVAAFCILSVSGMLAWFFLQQQ